jgi:hypothetical protein
MNEFDGELKRMLEKDHPNYLKTLEERGNDLMRKDCAIVITGKVLKHSFLFTYYCNF